MLLRPTCAIVCGALDRGSLLLYSLARAFTAAITRRQLRFNKENIVAKTQFLAKESGACAVRFALVIVACSPGTRACVSVHRCGHATAVELDVELQPGQYVVVPCTFYPANEGKFTISFASSGSIKISPLPPTGEWRCVTAKVCCSLLVARCSLLVARCSLLVALDHALVLTWRRWLRLSLRRCRESGRARPPEAARTMPPTSTTRNSCC